MQRGARFNLRRLLTFRCVRNEKLSGKCNEPFSRIKKKRNFHERKRNLQEERRMEREETHVRVYYALATMQQQQQLRPGETRSTSFALLARLYSLSLSPAAAAEALDNLSPIED